MKSNSFSAVGGGGMFIEKWISVYEYMLVNSYLVFHVNFL